LETSALSEPCLLRIRDALRARPVKAHMFAGLPGPIPFEAKGVGDFELDGGELPATYFTHHLRKLRGPSTSPTAEDRLQRLALPFIGSLIKEDSCRHFGPSPDISLEGRHQDEIETVEPDITVSAFPNVVGEHPVTLAECRRLRERARTRDITVADIELVAFDVPPGNIRHRVSLPSGPVQPSPRREFRAREICSIIPRRKLPTSCSFASKREA